MQETGGGGREREVTEENLEEYLELYSRYKIRGDGSRLAAFQRGLERELPPGVMLLLKEAFTSHECQVLISGACEVDVQDMRRWTEYDKVRSMTHTCKIHLNHPKKNTFLIRLMTCSHSNVPLSQGMP